MPEMQWIRVLLLIGLAWIAGSTRNADGQLAASGLADASTEQSHAWGVIVGADQDGPTRSYLLLHVPPRNGLGAAPAGHARVTRTFEEMPRALAADRNKVYLAFELQGRDGLARLRVRALDAVWRARAWTYEPRDRLEAHPMLTARGSAVAMAVSERRVLVAMLLDNDNIELHLLEGGVWTSIDLPADFGGQLLSMSGDGSGFSLVTRLGGESTTRWKFELSDEGTVHWQRTTLGRIEPQAVKLLDAGRLSILATSELELTRFSIMNPDGVVVPVTSLDVGTGTLLIPLWSHGPRVLALRWADQQSNQGRLPRLETKELSLSSGAVLYSGELPPDGMLPGSEVPLLALMLIVILISVLVIAIKGSNETGAVHLPQDTALAEPLRRLLATALDFGIAAQVAGLFFGIRFWEIVSLLLLIHVDTSWLVVPATFGVGLTIGTLLEWLSGRTLGKWLVGCRVVRVGDQVEQPLKIGFIRALKRNVIKWIMPPVAALVMLDPSRRHRGDQLAGVAVVVELEPVGPRT